MKVEIFGLEKIKFKTSSEAKNVLTKIRALSKEKGYATLYDIQKICDIAVLADEAEVLMSYGYTKGMIYDMNIVFDREAWNYYIESKRYTNLKASDVIFMDDKKVVLDIKIAEEGSIIKKYVLYVKTADGKERTCKLTGKLAMKILNDILEESTEVI